MASVVKTSNGPRYSRVGETFDEKHSHTRRAIRKDSKQKSDDSNC